MSGQSTGMQIPNQNMYTPQPQSFNQQFGQQQNMGGDIYPRYGQFQNQQQMQQQVQPMQQPNNGLLQTFGGGQLGYRQPMQPQMQQPAQQPAPSLLNQQVPGIPGVIPFTGTPSFGPRFDQPTSTPGVPNVNTEPRNSLYPFGNTGGPFPGSPARTPTGGFYDPRPNMINKARRNGTIFAGDENFTPARTPTGGFYDPRLGMIDEARRNGTIFAGDENFTPAPAPAPKPAFNRTRAVRARNK